MERKYTVQTRRKSAAPGRRDLVDGLMAQPLLCGVWAQAQSDQEGIMGQIKMQQINKQKSRLVCTCTPNLLQTTMNLSTSPHPLMHSLLRILTGVSSNCQLKWIDSQPATSLIYALSLSVKIGFAAYLLSSASAGLSSNLNNLSNSITTCGLLLLPARHAVPCLQS